MTERELTGREIRELANEQISQFAKAHKCKKIISVNQNFEK